MEPQQSPLYARYMKRLKWDVVPVGGANVFLKRFPFLGVMAKIHRPTKLPPLNILIPYLHENRVRRLVVEPAHTETQSYVTQWARGLPSGIKLNHSPFLPTKTIRIDLTRSTEELFAAFTEAKRRAVRRAVKLGVTVRESGDIDGLIRVKNSSGGLFGFITTTGIKELWNIFSPQHATILLAYSPRVPNKIIGGVLLLFWDHIAYYWIAGATKQGKKLFAPTLLVWETLKHAKKRRERIFDFIGVWDERIPKENTSWKGFTKFKEGFGGQTMYYPLI